MSVAERVGFEPTIGSPRLRFSRPVQSTALPPLRSTQLNSSCAFYQGTEAVSEVDVSASFPLCVMRRARTSPAPCRGIACAYSAQALCAALAKSGHTARLPGPPSTAASFSMSAATLRFESLLKRVAHVPRCVRHSLVVRPACSRRTTGSGSNQLPTTDISALPFILTPTLCSTTLLGSPTPLNDGRAGARPTWCTVAARSSQEARRRSHQ
jgi:hypothetical protein